jgi:probable rRNA maturation factor
MVRRPRTAPGRFRVVSPGKHKPTGLRAPVAESALVSVSYAVARGGLPSPLSFRRWVHAALEGALRREPAELAIRMVGAREGRMLNRVYRGKDYATNVLSFPVELPRGVALPLLGDLVICAPVVAREARAQGKPLAHHYAHLTVHGVLHLLGHEHEGAREATKMEMLEQRILERFGIPDPYAGR